MPRASRLAEAQPPAEVLQPEAPAPEAPVPEASGRPKPGILGFGGDNTPVGEVVAPAPMSVELTMHKVIEPGWVPPEMRANADYQAKQNEAAERDLAKDRPKDNPWDGGPRGVRIIGASPNMAKDQKAHVLF